MDEDQKALKAEQFAWVVRNVLRDEFTMGGQFKTIVRDVCPEAHEPKCTHKEDMFWSVKGLYLSLTDDEIRELEKRVLRVEAC